MSGLDGAYVSRLEAMEERRGGEVPMYRNVSAEVGLSKEINFADLTLARVTSNEVSVNAATKTYKSLEPTTFGELFSNVMQDRLQRSKMQIFLCDTLKCPRSQTVFYIAVPSFGLYGEHCKWTFDFEARAVTRNRINSGFLSPGDLMIVRKGYRPFPGVEVF